MYDYSRKYALAITINGKTDADEYIHTDGNTYIEARNGSEYSLSFANNTHKRVKVVLAVDGLSVINGEKAGIQSPGYIVDAYDTLNVTGWLKNENEVAKFVFWDKENSYSNKSGRGNNNTGVIGALVFEEYEFPKPFNDWHSYQPMKWTYTGPHDWHAGPYFGTPSHGVLRGMSADIGSTNAVFTASSNIGADTKSTPRRVSLQSTKVEDVQEAGTGHGPLEEFKTTSTNFTARDANNPDAKLVLYYDTSRGLERRGIVLKYKQNYCPDPFPAVSK